MQVFDESDQTMTFPSYEPETKEEDPAIAEDEDEADYGETEDYFRKLSMKLHEEQEISPEDKSYILQLKKQALQNVNEPPAPQPGPQTLSTSTIIPLRSVDS